MQLAPNKSIDLMKKLQAKIRLEDACDDIQKQDISQEAIANPRLEEQVISQGAATDPNPINSSVTSIIY